MGCTCRGVLVNTAVHHTPSNAAYRAHLTCNRVCARLHIFAATTHFIIEYIRALKRNRNTS